jgi:hypothetical protein
MGFHGGSENSSMRHIGCIHPKFFPTSLFEEFKKLFSESNEGDSLFRRTGKSEEPGCFSEFGGALDLGVTLQIMRRPVLHPSWRKTLHVKWRRPEA